MKKTIFALLILALPMVLQAKDKPQSNTNVWDKILTTTDTDVYIDSTNIKNTDNGLYASVKTVYTTAQARENYIANIEKAFTKDASKKIQKWSDFTYTVTYGLYDCLNERFKILKIEDFDSNGKSIIKTEKKEDKATWINVESDTVGSQTLSSICNYEPTLIVVDEEVDVIDVD